MAIFSISIRAHIRRNILNGVYDAAFERRFGLKPGTMAVSQESGQIVDSAHNIIDKSSVPVVTRSKEGDSQKSLQCEDGSLEPV